VPIVNGTPLRGQAGGVRFGERNQYVFVATSAGVQTWDLEAHEWSHLTIDHQSRVLSIDLTPIAGLLVTAGLISEPGLRIWNLADATQPILSTAKYGVRDVTFDGSGGSLYFVSEDNKVYSLNLDPHWWKLQACRTAGRDLTPEEWKRYLPGQSYERTCTL
jgi:hypothetical protein